jgi:hypothetical protein
VYFDKKKAHMWFKKGSKYDIYFLEQNLETKIVFMLKIFVMTPYKKEQKKPITNKFFYLLPYVALQPIPG